MDPEAFFNWDAMDDEDLDTYPNSSFINSNFEHSVFTEAILHPSFAEIQQPTYESNNVKRYSNYELNQQQQLQQPIKQEPTGLVNYIFSDFYNNSPMNYQQPSGINPRVISNYNQNNSNSSVFLNQNSSHQGKYSNSSTLNNDNQNNMQFSHNPQLLSPLYSNTFQMHRQQQQQQQQNNFIDITVDEQPPVEVRTRTPGENR